METEFDNATLLQRVYSRSYEILESKIEIIASWRIGQNFLKQTDNFLWIIEKSAEWSLPADIQTPNKQSDSNGTFGKPSPLLRPLPWILFLPMLIFLRVIRASINLGAITIGADGIKSTDVVKFLQNRRRKLRALKYRGLRRMPNRRTNKNDQNTFIQKVKNTLSTAMCLNYQHNDETELIIAKGNASDTFEYKDQKRKFDERDTEVDEDESISELLNKLEEPYDSEEDPDYIPFDESDDDESDSDPDEEPILAKPLLKRPSSLCSLTQEVITEVNEDTDTSVEANTQPKTPPKPKINEEIKPNSKQNLVVDSVTSDEFYSPINSICASPEPKKDTTNVNSKCEENDTKQVSKDFINNEKSPNTHEKNSENVHENNLMNSVSVDEFYSPKKENYDRPENTLVQNNGVVNGSTSNQEDGGTNNFRSYKKKTKKYRNKFKNCLQRKRR